MILRRHGAPQAFHLQRSLLDVMDGDLLSGLLWRPQKPRMDNTAQLYPTSQSDHSQALPGQ